MSIEVSKFYWDKCTDIKGNDRLVIIAMADYCNEGGSCYPSVRELARRCQLSDRGVQKILAKLVAGGHLLIEANKGSRKTSGSPTHLYHLLAYQRSINAPKGERIGSPLKGEQVSSPLEDAKGEQNAIRVNNSTPKGELASSPDPIDPSIDPGSDDDRARANTPPPPALSSSPVPVERIRLPAKALAALTAPSDPAYVAACAAWGKHMAGSLTPLLEQEIKLALQTYPPEWIPLAMETAAGKGKHFWGYVAGILRTWDAEGVNHASHRQTTRTNNTSKSMGYGRQMQPAPSTKGPTTDENDPDWQEFVAGFRDCRDVAHERYTAQIAASD